jgi:hypothetical protein
MTDRVVQVGGTYALEWDTADVAVCNSFINDDGTSQDFFDPPDANGAALIEIEVRGPTPKLNNFPKIKRPDVTSTTNKDNHPVKRFSASFKAREAGTYVFTIKLNIPRSITRTLIVAPRYNTIEEVINGDAGADPTVVRRQAVLASAADFFPAFATPDPYGLHVGGGSGKMDLLDQGEDSDPAGKIWRKSYAFDGSSGATSCTVVNPLVVNGKTQQPIRLRNNASNQWAFSAGPLQPPGPNPAWRTCGPGHLPSVGDTYIVSNRWHGQDNGHVGVVLHVPPSGNGLWVTADGGQMGINLAILVPRWGLMAEHLPKHGGPGNPYPEMRLEKRGPPFLSGARAGELNPADKPQQNDDIEKMINRIHFRPGNPRRMIGFVSLSAVPDLKFQNLDGTAPDPTTLDKCRLLKRKVDRVIQAFLDGRVLG